MALTAIGTPESPFSSPAANMNYPSPYGNSAPPPNFFSMPYGVNPNGTNFNSVTNWLGGPTKDQVYSPGTQSILDLIQQKGDQTRQRAVSEAQALAARRGLSGSSTEQFGTAQAGTQADQATIDSQIATLNNGLTMANQRNIAGAQLSSDELASVRNWMFGQQNLALQQNLGQQGIDVARSNIDAANHQADQAGRNNLISSLGSAILPRVLFGGGGGGGGGLSSLFGGGGGLLSNFFGGGGGMAANGGMAAPAGAGSSLFPGGLGALGAAGGGGFFGSMGAIPGLGLLAGGGLLASGVDNMTKDTLMRMFGNTGGAVARQLMNPVGATINFGKQVLANPGKAASSVASGISHSIKKVFPF